LPDATVTSVNSGTSTALHKYDGCGINLITDVIMTTSNFRFINNAFYYVHPVDCF
jgi:hypothetical protein